MSRSLRLMQRAEAALAHGPSPAPAEIERGWAEPLAVWRGERVGAVLFVLHRRDGAWEEIDVVAARRGDGSWNAHTEMGGPFLDGGPRRPVDGGTGARSPG